MTSQIISYFAQRWPEWLTLVTEHLWISGLSLAAAAAIAVPLGMLCSTRVWAERMATGITGVLRVIPSLAVLIICVPILGVGDLPAIIALTVLAIPPILINTAVAFREVPASVVEAARGMGMNNWQLFAQIKAPLAFPLAFSGLRTAATEVVASATLAAYIGAGGLGVLIYTGLGALRHDLLWIGGISVAVLSMAINQLLAWIDRRARRYERAAQSSQA